MVMCCVGAELTKCCALQTQKQSLGVCSHQTNLDEPVFMLKRNRQHVFIIEELTMLYECTQSPRSRKYMCC